MAQAMRAMQVTALKGAIAGSSQNVSAKRVVVLETRRPELTVRASMKEFQAASIASSVVLADAGAANALTAEDVTRTYLKVQSTASQVAGAASETFSVAKNSTGQVVDAVKPAVTAVTPYVKQSADFVYKTVFPIATNIEKQAENALRSNGVDTKPVLDAAKTAAGEVGKYVEGAQPTISRTLQNILSSDPILLATGAGALALLYLLTPPLLSSISYAARGFKGELTAPQALDLLSNENYILIDVRSEKEKAKSGIPSLPRNAKNKFLPVPVQELPGKVRGQLRNYRKVEAEITALKISSLKKIDKGTRLIVIDSNGDTAKTIAMALLGQGYNNTWVITDGFEGGRGWVQSRLGTEAAVTSIVEIMSPSRVTSPSTKFLQAGSN